MRSDLIFETQPTNSLIIEDLTFKNMAIDSGLNHILFYFVSSSPILFNMKNFIFQNSIINNVKTLLLFDYPEGDIIANSVLFTHISVDESISFFKLKQAKTFKVNYLNFEN